MKNEKRELIFKRAIAAILDVTLVFIASFFIFFMVVGPISEKTTGILELQEKYDAKYEEYGIKIWNELEGEYIDNKDATEEATKAFNNDPEVIELANKINSISFGETAISIALSATIFYILFPLISKNGKTLGKKALGIKVISQNGETIKKSQIAIREISFVIIEFSGGIITYGIIPLISFGLIIFSKNKISIHDYISKTDVSLIKLGKKHIVKEEDDEYYNQIALEEARDLRVGGRKNDK